MHTTLADDLRRCEAGVSLAEDFGAGAPGMPSDRELIRLGRRSGLDVHQTVALVLKAQWEVFRRGREGGDADRPPEVAVGPRAGLRRAGCRSREFHVGCGGLADAGGLFALFEEDDRYASRGGYDREGFESLVHQCLLLGLHLVSIHGPEMAAFASARRAESALLRGASAAEREAYWREHCRWRETEDEVGALLLEVEAAALENRRVEQRWMERFGSAYLALREEQARCDALERGLQRKADAPHLTLEELERLESEHRGDEERDLARLRRCLARARLDRSAGPGGMPLEDAELWDYEDEGKKLLRAIYRLTHPDAVARHGFTEAQRELLTACYREAVACGDPSAVDDEEVALGMRSLASLEAILRKARRVWESMGLSWNEDAAIRGETLAERLAWLEARIAELEGEARDVRADLYALANDPDVREKRASLASPGVAERVARELEETAAALSRRASELEERLQGLFRPGGGP